MLKSLVCWRERHNAQANLAQFIAHKMGKYKKNKKFKSDHM